MKSSIIKLLLLILTIHSMDAHAQTLTTNSVVLEIMEEFYTGAVENDPWLDHGRAAIQKEALLSHIRKFEQMMTQHFVDGKAIFKDLPPEIQTALIRHFEKVYDAYRCLPETVQAELLDPMEILNREFRSLQTNLKPLSKVTKQVLTSALREGSKNLREVYEASDFEIETKSVRYYQQLELSSMVRFLEIFTSKAEQHHLSKAQMEQVAEKIRSINEFFTKVMSEPVITGDAVARTSLLEKFESNMGSVLKDMIAKWGYHQPIRSPSGQTSFVTPLEVFQGSIVKGTNMLAVEVELSILPLVAPETGERKSKGYDVLGETASKFVNEAQGKGKTSELRERFARLKLHR